MDPPLVVTSLDFNPANPGSIPTGTQMSHRWRREGRPTRSCSLHQKSPTLHVGMSEPL